MAEDQNTKEVQAYTDIPYIEMETEPANEDLTRVRALQAGFGSKVLRVDKQGLWMGAEDFASAPFSVDMEGNMVASSITIVGYIPTGGALADIGAGNITSTYIGSNAITTSKIAANAVTATQIAAGSVTASKINVAELSAISADIGDITAGTITSVTITGGTIRTGTSGKRVQMSGSTIKFYDSGGDKRVESSDGGVQFYDETGSSVGEIYALSTGITGASDFIVVDASVGAGHSIVMDVDNTGIFGIASDHDIKYFFTDTGMVFEENMILDGNLWTQGSGTNDIGDSVDYWGDVNYKSLVDRGCIPFYDEGVELRDGRVVSDLQALKEIKPHPTFKTPAGRVRLDYRTMPKDVYRPAVHPETGELLPRDEDDRPYIVIEKHRGRLKKLKEEKEKVFAEDGAETTALIGILLGSIKELDARLEKVEAGDKSPQV